MVNNGHNMISIIICTYNRSDKLKNLLKSFQNMHDSGETLWELIVVDNNSTDDTKHVADEFSRIFSTNFRYFTERKQGAAYARNKGFENSIGEIIAVIDDDCIVDDAWLSALAREFASDSVLSVLGGRVELYDGKAKPVSIRPSRTREVFDSPDQLFSLIPGCNMAFRREVYERVGGFDTWFGPGARIPPAEDVDFIYRAYKAGFKILYSPDVLVYHDHGRNTDAAVRQVKRGYVIGRGAFYCKYIFAGDRAILKCAYWEVNDLIRRLFGNPFRGRSVADELRMLWHLLLGAAYWLRACICTSTAR